MLPKHWIEESGECQYCGGNSRCYPCSGKGGTEEDGECNDCHGSGVCAQCIGGVEQWLFYEAGSNRKRGSCLTRYEALQFQQDGTLPEWWASYHGVTP